ncbi:MAG: TetR/AcrR family transcriptional regulator [Nitrososphaerales archaeon]|jgi:AcrR family transcriptional regulator
MPRTEQAYEEMRDRANRRILEAARRVFARKGLGATVADIAEEAGVSQGLAYRYFPSKEAIFHTLLRQMLQPGEADRLSEESEKTPRERLERFVSETMRLRQEHPEFYRFVFQAVSEQNLPEDIRHRLGAHGLEIRGALRRLVIEGQAKGEVSEGEPDQLVDVILACLEGLSMRLAYSDPSTKVQLPDAGIILRLLGPDPSKERGGPT